MTWSQIPDGDVTRRPVLAPATLATYFVIIVVLASVSFQRRDIAGAS